MTQSTAGKKAIGNALIWSAMIIVTSLLVTDDKAAATLLFVHIAGWWATNQMIGAGGGDALQTECAAIKSLFSRNKPTD